MVQVEDNSLEQWEGLLEVAKKMRSANLSEVPINNKKNFQFLVKLASMDNGKRWMKITIAGNENGTTSEQQQQQQQQIDKWAATFEGKFAFKLLPFFEELRKNFLEYNIGVFIRAMNFAKSGLWVSPFDINITVPTDLPDLFVLPTWTFADGPGVNLTAEFYRQYNATKYEQELLVQFDLSLKYFHSRDFHVPNNYFVYLAITPPFNKLSQPLEHIIREVAYDRAWGLAKEVLGHGEDEEMLTRAYFHFLHGAEQTVEPFRGILLRLTNDFHDRILTAKEMGRMHRRVLVVDWTLGYFSVYSQCLSNFRWMVQEEERLRAKNAKFAVNA